MAPNSADVVICGAGIAGIATAYHLSVWQGIRSVLLVDERSPLTFTSDKSTECYRNWWPGPGTAMVSLMNRSIDIMETLAGESGNVFHLNRRGYLFATADREHLDDFRTAAAEPATLGAGQLRIHNGQQDVGPYIPPQPAGFAGEPDGADLILDQALIRAQFPYLSPETIAVLHVRRAGWLSAQQLGMFMLERAKEQGVRFLSGKVVAVETVGGCVQVVHVAYPGGEKTIFTNIFVNAAGPFLWRTGTLLGVDIPVFAELHMKVMIKDRLEIVPRGAPLLIWNDTQYLPWNEAERALFAESDADRRLLELFPAGVHTRPEGGPGSTTILILWDYHERRTEPVPNPPLDPLYAEIALRGLATMLPQLRAYFGRMPKPLLDGGYYVKTRENRPLIGPLPVAGSYLIGALSGYGIMASSAAGELLAAHIAGVTLPDYAPAFSLARYQDPAYQALLEDWTDSGQL